MLPYAVKLHVSTPFDESSVGRYQNQHTTRMSFFSNSSRILAMDGPFSRYPETFFVLLLAFFSVAYRVGNRQNISVNWP